MRRWTLALSLLCAGVPVVAYAGSIPESAKSFIPQTCCWTSKACRIIPRSEYERVGITQYRLKLTGASMDRNGWSKDENSYICEATNTDAGWKVGPGEKIRCFYPTAEHEF